LLVSLPAFSLLRQPFHNKRTFSCAVNIKNKARPDFFFA